MNKLNILRQQATVDSFGDPHAVTLQVSGTYLTGKSVTFSLPRDGQRRETLIPANGSAWQGKQVILVVLPEEAPRTGYLVGFEVDGDLVFTKPINFKKSPTNPPQRIPAQQRAAPQPVPAQSKAVLGYTQASSSFRNEAVTVTVKSPFVLEIGFRGEVRELRLAELKFKTPFRLAGIGIVTVHDFLFQGSLWNGSLRVKQPGQPHDFLLEIAINPGHQFWLRADGATVDARQPHEAALLLAQKAAQGDAGDEFVREIEMFSAKAQPRYQGQNRRHQGHGHHHHSHGQQNRPQPPRPAGPKPGAMVQKSMQPAPRPQTQPTPPSPKSDGPVSGDAQGASVVLQIPANSKALIHVEVQDVEGAKPSVTAAAVVCEQPTSLPSARVVEGRAPVTETSRVAEVVSEPARQPEPVAVEESKTEAQAPVTPKTPMEKFLARQEKTRQFRQANRRATPADAGQGDSKPKGKSLDDLARELRKS